MKIRELEMADIDFVEIINGTPHCRKHGAMNKVSSHGLWRCVSTYRLEYQGNTKPRLIGNACRAGCVEV